MIKSARKSTVVLLGLFALPTSAKFTLTEPSKCSAFKPGQEAFVLKAVDEDGYPAAVIMTADEGTLDLQVGDEVDTQHAQVRKNLPKRVVQAILRADGTVEGDAPPKGLGLPHWEFIPVGEGGGASLPAINEVAARIEANKERREREAAELKAAKAAAKGQKAA